MGVDERIDKTKKEMGEGMKGAKRYQVVKKEHATVIFWPGETYEGHVVPTGGTGKELAKSTFNFLKSRQTDLSQLKALLGDGCSKVTGCWNGFMAERSCSCLTTRRSASRFRSRSSEARSRCSVFSIAFSPAASVLCSRR